MTAPVKLLLVDDKPGNLIALEELLRQADREIFKAHSGNEGLRLMLKHDFALVLLDVEMPDMDGYETAALMRSVDRSCAVPIVFVTAGDRADERSFRGYDVGAVDFLYKPINSHVLKSKVRVFIELYRQREELHALNAVLERTSGALRERIADLENVNQTLSHDLRAPVRSIQGFAALLEESLAGKLDAEDADHLGRVLRASQRLGRMIDDLYRLLRLSAADSPAVDCDSGLLLQGALDDLRADVEASDAAITHDAMPTLRANPTLLGQVFLNLIANALRFHGADPPRVHVSAERADQSWRFAVRDHGVGIAPGLRERLFGIFQRGGGDAASGSGVGLALCRRAVEKHGGRIWVEPADGGGSVFSFTIPDP